jgi:5'-nucleotidase
LKILISNDDGINARGIELLEEACREVGDVTVVAPDREQSASSHALTMRRPLRTEKRGDGRFQVDGTPTDCVLLALEIVVDSKPDFVFSGVNHGPNMGEDVLYSGTVAAAMEGLSLGIPGVAMSYAGRDLRILETQRGWIRQVAGELAQVKSFPEETLLNVNFPPIPGDQIRGVRVTSLGRRVYSNSVRRMLDPWDRETYWIGGGTSKWTGGKDSDFRAIEEGFISITPVHVDLTNYGLLEEVKSWGIGA